MRGSVGILFLDNAEIVIRIYAPALKGARLLYQHTETVYDLDEHSFVQRLSEFMATHIAQETGQWKLCSRHLPQSLVTTIAQALEIPIENISPFREQELLCKGLFAELW